MKPRPAIAALLPAHDGDQHNVRFKFASSAGTNGVLWSDNGIIRVEPHGIGGPRFRLDGHNRITFIQALLSPHLFTHPIETTTGSVQVKELATSIRVQATRAAPRLDDNPCSFRLTWDQTAAFHSTYVDMLAWAKAMDLESVLTDLDQMQHRRRVA